MNPDLVGTSSVDADIEERIAVEALPDSILSKGIPSPVGSPELLPVARITLYRRVDETMRSRYDPLRNRRIMLLCRMRCELSLQ